MKYLLRLIIGIYLLCPIFSQAEIIQHQISDDGYVRVPLQFPFPLYGRVFTESYMFSNGVIGFLNPTNTWCCNGFDLRNSTGSPFDYAIMPLQTDLLNYNGRFLTEGTPQYQRYKWENISEFGAPNNLNTFGVEIRPSGYIGMHYEQVNLNPWRQVTIGVTGNTSQGEFNQLYYGSGFSQANFSHIIESTGNTCITNPLSSPTCAGYQEAYTAQQCSISPLYSPSCVGYEAAYHDQQCSLNPLYATSCQGYEQAYFNQQCSLNPLYNSQCQGYAEAYHSQQCSLNPLYAVTCSGYRQAYYNQQCGLNPLYDTGCVGYEAAYFNQQCSRNPLYNSGCQGYAEAYFNYQCTQSPLYNSRCQGYAEAYLAQQCSINSLYSPNCPNYQQAYHNQQCSQNPLYATTCTGYEQAYFNQQCSLSPLYNSRCNGYAEAYLAQQCGISQLYSTQCPNYQQAYHAQQCSLNQLYATTCPNYQQAYFNEQCRLNPLYDRTCTGYAEAYALANVVPATTQKVSTTVPSVQVSTTGTVSVETPIVKDTVVNEVITRPQVANANPTTNTQAVQTERLSQAEPKTEKKPEAKQVATVKKPEIKNDISTEAPKIVAPVHEYKAPIILDLAYMQMVKKPIKDNNRAMYNLIMNSQHKHEEMVDEQYRR